MNQEDRKLYNKNYYENNKLNILAKASQKVDVYFVKEMYQAIIF